MLQAYEIQAEVRIPQATAEDDGGGSPEGEDEEADIQVFSNGSGINNKVGATMVMYRRGQESKTVRYHIGALTDHMVFEAEAIGLLLARHLLSFERDAGKVKIWLDNQAVLSALLICKPRPVQSIIDHMISQIESNWKQSQN